MRVYVPATLATLKALPENGFGAPVAAHAVTPALREWYADGDAEELEYAASDEAAEAALRLLADDPGAPRRRVVVAADVPDSVVQVVGGAGARSAVVVGADVALDAVASLHVDDADALQDVAAAAAAVPAAAAGDEDAQFAVDGAAGHELLWYDVTELDDVLDLR